MAVPRTKNKAEARPRHPLYKDDVFETYVLWRSLPALLRGQDAATLQGEGIEDPLVIDLLAIRTQLEFCKRFKIGSAGTLTEWNKRIDEGNLLSPARTAWAKRLTSNVMKAFYAQTVKEGDASRTKLWFQLVEGWEEKSTQTVAGLDELSQALKALAERK